MPVSYLWDFPGRPVVKTHASTTGGTGLIPGQGTKILNAVLGAEIK